MDSKVIGMPECYHRGRIMEDKPGVIQASSANLSIVATHLRAAIGLRAAIWNSLLHQNSSLFTVTFAS